MDRWRLLVVLRTVLLASLPVYFASALVWTLLRERPDLLRDQQQGFGQDPGVRVLLTDRERGGRERRDLTVGVLQPALLSCPDNPEAWRVTVAPDTAASRELLLRAGPELLEMIWIVSQVTIGPATGNGWQISVSKAAGAKCPRCWRWQADVGSHATHPDLCGRCARVVTERAAGGAGNP